MFLVIRRSTLRLTHYLRSVIDMISDYVKFKLELERYCNTRQIEEEIEKVCDHINALTAMPEYEKDVDDLRKQIDKARLPLIVAQSHLAILLANITEDVDRMSQKYFKRSYDPTMLVDADHIRNTPSRNLTLTPSIEAVLLGRIQHYTDWHYPGMQIGPRDGELTPHMVACDPLYLVDVHPEFLASAAKQFPEQYQARLRSYCIGNKRNERGLAALPQNQIGFILCWAVFNFLPFDEIRKYLVDVFEVLRPGGTMLFSYNNGDTVQGARNAEWGGMTFIPKHMLVPLCESLGFTVSESYSFEAGIQDISWLEITKPGQLSTCKAHQVLGMVKDTAQ